MKKKPYRTTDSGVRIPKRKTKWMKPQKEKVPESSELLSPNLFRSNLNCLFNIADGRSPDEVIDVEVTDSQGGEQNYD